MKKIVDYLGGGLITILSTFGCINLEKEVNLEKNNIPKQTQTSFEDDRLKRTIPFEEYYKSLGKNLKHSDKEILKDNYEISKGYDKGFLTMHVPNNKKIKHIPNINRRFSSSSHSDNPLYICEASCKGLKLIDDLGYYINGELVTNEFRIYCGVSDYMYDDHDKVECWKKLHPMGDFFINGFEPGHYDIEIRASIEGIPCSTKRHFEIVK